MVPGLSKGLELSSERAAGYCDLIELVNKIRVRICVFRSS